MACIGRDLKAHMVPVHAMGRAAPHQLSCPEKLWCPIPGGTQGQVGWGPGQLSWWVAVLPTARGLELDGL